MVDGSASTFMRSDAAPAVQVATTSKPGLVQPDGTTITISGDVISSVGGSSTLTIGTNLISGGTSGYALTVGASNELETPRSAPSCKPTPPATSPSPAMTATTA